MEEKKEKKEKSKSDFKGMIDIKGTFRGSTNEDTEKQNTNNSFINKVLTGIKKAGPSKIVIMLMLGIFLLIVPVPIKSADKSSDNVNTKEVNAPQEDAIPVSGDETKIYVTTLEKRLKGVLSKVEGIGAVEVMITLKGSSELVILKDSPYTQERINEVDGEGGSRITSSFIQEENTIMVEREDGSNSPYVLQELEPQVEGILVIAQGGNNSEIINQIVEASQVLFGVPEHKVKVMKMN